MAFSLYQNPMGRSPFFTPPIVGALPDAPPDAAVGYPTRQRAAAPRFDFGFLRHPFDGGNIGKTLFSGLGLLALAHDPAQTLTGLFSGLNNYMGTRQGVLNQQYADQGAQYTADERARQFDAAQQAKADALAATQDYRNRTLAAHDLDRASREQIAGQNLAGGIYKSVVPLAGADSPEAQAAYSGTGLPALPRPAVFPGGSSPLGFVPAADGQGVPATAPVPRAYPPESVFGNRAANTARTLAAIPGVQANSDLAVGALPYKLASAALDPRIKAANLTGIKTRTAGEQQRIGESRKMFPGKLEQQTLTNDMIRTGRLPLLGEQLQHQQIVNQFLPAQLQTNLDATRARTQSTLSGGAKANPRVLGLGSEIGAAAGKYNVDPAIVAGVIDYESGGNPDAVNGSHVGLGQFGVKERQMYGGSGPDAVAHYLSDLQKRTGSIEGALSAYGDQTASYVPNVLERASRYRTSVKAPKAAAAGNVNSYAASAAQKFGWQGSKAEGSAIVSHYMRLGTLEPHALSVGILAVNPGHETEFAEMGRRLRANNGRGAKAKAATAPGGPTVFELP